MILPRDKNNKVKAGFAPLFEKITRIPNPYNLYEALTFLWRNYHGPNPKKRGGINYLPQQYTLNAEITPKYTICLIGDILDTRGRNAIVANDVKDFTRGCDYLIGNLESTITEREKHSPLSTRIFLRHRPEIIDTLAEFFPPEKTYLSIANNHTGDYPEKVVRNSIEILQNHGFRVFGWKKSPYIDINDDLRVITGTSWSNSRCDFVCMLNKKTLSFCKNESFNLLFPHWGHELELYPRPKVINKAKMWIKKFDAIVGHHGHTPQPITFQRDHDISKLICYCLGDFIAGFTEPWFQYGEIIKLRVGETETRRWRVGEIQWNFNHTYPTSTKRLKTTLTDVCPYIPR